MASILAIVSRKVFERDFRVGDAAASVGDVVATSAYASTHPSLTKLSAGGDLFLVTVAPGEQLLLAGVLAAPKFHKDRWSSAANSAPVTDISSLIPKLQFENGKGLTAKAGALAMSLQTPRTLADSDADLLRAAAGKGALKASAAKVSAAKVSGAKAADAKPAANRDAGADDGDDDKDAPSTKGEKTRAAKATGSKATGAKATGAPGAKRGASTDEISFAADSPLSAAGKQLAAGAYTAALDDMLRGWEHCKAAELGALIYDYGKWLAGKLPAITGNKITLDAAWREVGELGRPVDVPRLAGALLTYANSKQAEGWFDALDLFPLDPRLCTPAIEMTTKFVASSAGPCRTRAFRMAEKVADGRCIPAIDKLIKKDMNAWNTKDLKDRLRKMRAKFADPPALPASDQAAFAALAKQVAVLAKQPSPDEATLFARGGKAASGDGERLLAEVLAAPDDDAPRLVYADFLQESGDPRGELIALQLQKELTPAQQDRVDALVRDKKNISRWLGPLVPVVTEPFFKRGFLDACAVTLKTPKHEKELINHPLWATVRMVRTDQIEVVESPALKSLREVDGLAILQVLALVRRSKPFPLEKLTSVVFNAYVDDADDQGEQGMPLWEELCKVGALSKLRSLGIDVHWESAAEMGLEPAGAAWLFASRLGRQLEEFAIRFSISGREMPRIARWLALFRTNKQLQRLEHRVFGRQVGTVYVELATVAIRDGSKQRIELHLWRIFDDRVDRPLRWDIEKVPALLDGFPDDNAPTLRAVVKTKATRKQLDLLQAHLEQTLAGRFTEITTIAE